MALLEDLDVFLADHGVSVTAGAVSGVGILDAPGMMVIGDNVISTDYTLTCKALQFGDLLYNAAITVHGVSYEVMENRLLDDGGFCQMTLRKVLTEPGLVTDPVIDGGDPDDVYPDENIYDGGTP